MSETAVNDAAHRRLQHLDSAVEQLKDAYEAAIEEVTSRPELDASMERRLSDVAQRLAGLRPQLEAADLDMERKAALLTALIDVMEAMRAKPGDLDRFEQALIGIEKVRHVVRDALDEFVGGNTADRRRLLAEVTRRLRGVRQADIAELLNVDPRTVRRWRSEAGEPDQRLLIVARLVAVLRHAWTPPGTVAWFKRPRRELDGHAPIDLLDDPGEEARLLSAARSSRTQYGT